jgi:hypothetical protein
MQRAMPGSVPGIAVCGRVVAVREPTWCEATASTPQHSCVLARGDHGVC